MHIRQFKHSRAHTSARGLFNLDEVNVNYNWLKSYCFVVCCLDTLDRTRPFAVHLLLELAKGFEPLTL
jgi:hypothetical protein